MDRSTEHIQFLDRIRGAAVFGVFAWHSLAMAFGFVTIPWGHYFQDFSEVTRSYLLLLPVTFGWAGVPAMCVVSGFCIHLSFLRGVPGNWPGFYVRRFFRIYPAYLIVLLFFALVFPVRPTFQTRYDWAQIGSHILLVHNFTERVFRINGSSWSIAVLAQLYLIYPALLWLAGRLGWSRTLLLLCSLDVLVRGLAGIFVTATFGELPHWFHTNPILFCYSWAIGAALADAFQRGRALPFASYSAWLWLLLAVASSEFRPTSFYPFLFFAVLTATVIAKLLTRPQPAVPVQSFFLRHLQLLGVSSYSFYLLHEPVLDVLRQVLHMYRPSLHPLVRFSALLSVYPLLLAMAWLSYRYCELKGIALGKRLLRTGKPSDCQTT